MVFCAWVAASKSDRIVSSMVVTDGVSCTAISVVRTRSEEFAELNGTISLNLSSEGLRCRDLMYSSGCLGNSVNSTAPGLAMSATNAACRAILCTTLREGGLTGLVHVEIRADYPFMSSSWTVGGCADEFVY